MRYLDSTFEVCSNRSIGGGLRAVVDRHDGDAYDKHLRAGIIW